MIQDSEAVNRFEISHEKDSISEGGDTQFMVII